MKRFKAVGTVKSPLCLIKYHAAKGYGGECSASHGQGKRIQYPQDRSLGGHQSRFRRDRGERSPASTKNKTPVVHPVA